MDETPLKMYVYKYLLKPKEGPVKHQVKWTNCFRVNNNLVNWKKIHYTVL